MPPSPFSHKQTRQLVLTCNKQVKTTAPKQYCVRPNAGRIEPGNSFDVTGTLCVPSDVSSGEADRRARPVQSFCRP